MQKPMQNRRHFIKNLSVLVDGFNLVYPRWSVSTALQGCSTIDEQLITDPSDLGDTVIIIGGGISPECMLLTSSENEKFHFEYLKPQVDWAENSFRSRFEYGAFEFSNSDSYLLALAKDLNLKIEKIDAKNWIFKNGTVDLLTQLTDRIGGVLPRQQIRLKNKLIHLQQVGSRFRVTFATDSSDKSYLSSKLLLALPAANLIDLKGYNDPQVEMQFQTWRYTRVVIPASKLNIKNKSGAKDNIQYSVKLFKNLVYIDLQGVDSSEKYPLQIEKIGAWISENILAVPKSSLTLQPENIYIWKVMIHADTGAELRSIPLVKNRLVISDGLVAPLNRVESLLTSVHQHMDDLL
jgi:hypothetical protein